MVSYIKQIMANGYAYQTEDSSIYFDSKKYAEAGLDNNPFNLTQVNISFQNMLNNAAETQETDFCLWKGKKDNEPYYQTEIGDGRPGWHIECSAMASTITKNIDIHGGGIDLKFPHHHNEILQANAFMANMTSTNTLSTQRTLRSKWVNIFTHCGHLSIAGHKMAKTLKNFITIDDFIKKYQPQLIRLYFLIYPYQHELELSELEITKLEASNGAY
jgi:cysteinyl-tRNA synthetase